jgi:hypothetical protein
MLAVLAGLAAALAQEGFLLRDLVAAVEEGGGGGVGS